MPTLEIVQGAQKDFQLQVRDRLGNPFSDSNLSPFTDSDTLTTRVWMGDDLPTLLSPTTTWLDSTGIASYQITITGAQSTTLTEGIYRIQSLVTHAGATGLILDARLQVSPAPGTTAAKLAFTNLSHLLDFCPWIESVQSDNEEFAFTRQQARATTKLIDALCSLWKPQSMYPTAGQPGF